MPRKKNKFAYFNGGILRDRREGQKGVMAHFEGENSRRRKAHANLEGTSVEEEKAGFIS